MEVWGAGARRQKFLIVLSLIILIFGILILGANALYSAEILNTGFPSPFFKEWIRSPRTNVTPTGYESSQSSESPAAVRRKRLASFQDDYRRWRLVAASV